MTADASQPRRHRLAAIQAGVFAGLVVATFTAFFVAQRLKHSATVIQQLSSTPFVSPNGDGRSDVAHIGFLIDHRARLAVEIRDLAGHLVARPLKPRWVPQYRRVRVTWSADGVPDGRYHAVVVLGQKRITLTPAIIVDTAPPAVQLNPSSDTTGTGEYRLTTGGRKRRWARFVRRSGHWTLVGSWHRLRYRAVRIEVPTEDVSHGRYLVVAQARDTAGNVGYSVRWDRTRRRPHSAVPPNLRG
ncbi:MAG: hypothetical protein JWO74_5028 [Solirubrobacterales bacterium]|nr:hypothetical protein [Solirubrobacterales bacterium]